MYTKIFYLILLVLAGFSASATTYYYKIEKVVTDGIAKKSSGSGIFITFTSNGCYDSDSQGYSNHKSDLKFIYEKNYKVYNGTTYWGYGDYKFNSDLSRLNVVVGNSVYVYQRTTKPSGITTSSYIGQGNNSNNNSAVYVPVNNLESTTSDYYNESSNAMSAEWYQNTYNRYASNAEDIYRTITTRITDSNGNDVSGYVYKSYDSQISINSMIRNLRDTQRDMRDLRKEAARYGYRLLISPYENIDVKRY